MKTSSIIISTLIASAAGVAIGMLFAPEKGSRTRRKILEKNHEYSDFMSDSYDDIVDSVSKSLASIEDESKRIAKKAKKAAPEINADLK